jgi:hypothetical protein
MPAQGLLWLAALLVWHTVDSAAVSALTRRTWALQCACCMKQVYVLSPACGMAASINQRCHTVAPIV